jgi:hypothetical protein
MPFGLPIITRKKKILEKLCVLVSQKQTISSKKVKKY